MTSPTGLLSQTTPRHAANFELMSRLTAALAAGDWEATAALLHPDFVFHQPDALPYGGVYKGVEGFRTCFERVAGGDLVTEQTDLLRTYFSEDPDSLMLEFLFRGVDRRSGERFASKAAEQLEFRDGKLVAMTLYWLNIPPQHD
jgi:ketosteroid isomerase-like protein